MKNPRKNYRMKAMTLTELLIVLAILGILVLLALPNFTSIFQKTRSKEAQLNLKHLSTLQKTYFLVDKLSSEKSDAEEAMRAAYNDVSRLFDALPEMHPYRTHIETIMNKVHSVLYASRIYHT